MKFIQDVLHLLARQWRITMRMPIFLVVSIVQPITWMLLFSQLFGKITMLGGFGSSYVQFLAPGIAIMSALFGSGYAGMGLLNDIDRGVVDRLLATPVTRSALIVARVLHACMTVSVQGSVILGVAMILGARPKAGIASFGAVLLAAALLGGGMAGISNAMAIITRRQEAMFAVLNFTMLPMVYLSSMIMAKNLMPNWIRTVCRYNPVDWAVTVARNGFEGKEWASVGYHSLALAGFTVFFAMLATRAFRRYRASM
jgi:ABC-2 type transport system permease protein